MAAENRTEIARELLTQLTEDLRLTQAAIAAATGVSQGALGDLLRGRRGAGPVLREALARYFPEKAADLGVAAPKPGQVIRLNEPPQRRARPVSMDPVEQASERAVAAYLALHPEADRATIADAMAWVTDAHCQDDVPREPEWYFERLKSTIEARNKRLAQRKPTGG